MGVTGPYEAFVSVVAALTNAFSQVSSSQLQAVSGWSSMASREGRKVKAVAMAEFKPLHLVGKALSHFVGAHMAKYRACRKASSRVATKARNTTNGAKRKRRTETDTNQEEPSLEEIVARLRGEGAPGCHLPMVILKPRFAVYKKSPGKARSSKQLHVEVLPVINDTETEGGGKARLYKGPRARQYPPETPATPRPSFSSLDDAGIPIILFRLATGD